MSDNTYKQHAENGRNRHRKKRRRRANTAVWIAVIITLCTLTVFITFYVQRKIELQNRLISLNGTWEKDISVSTDFTTSSTLWLSDLDVSINPSELSDSIMEVSPKSTLTICISSDGSGTITESIDESSYNICRQKAYDIISDKITEIVIAKLTAAGYSETDLSSEEASILIEEILGTNLNSYLQENGLTLLSDYETYQACVEKKGIIAVDKDFISEHLTTHPANISAESIQTYSISADGLTLTLGQDVYTRVTQ